MKILIVEDDPVLSELLREYLQHLDHERVEVCLTAREALAVVKEDIYDCAFVDLRLPDMDGLRLLEIIKGQDPSLPIVMMSGYPTMIYTIEAMRRGACDFLTKPFTLQDMALALERVTKERRLLLENLSLKLEIEARNQLEIVNRELKGKIHEQTRLFEISKEIDEVRSSEDLYPRIVNLASRLTEAQKVGFFIVPPDQDNLFLISDHGLEEHFPSYPVAHIARERVRHILDSDKGHIVMKAEDLLDLARTADPSRDDGLFSCWPLRIRGELFGLLTTSYSGDPGVFPQMEAKLLDFLIKKSALAIENMALYESMIANFYGILRSLVNALEAKDLYTGKHSDRVTRYAVRIAQKMEYSVTQIEALQTVGYLHDIGKIGIADGILNKPGPLTAEEYELVKKHPAIGESIVAELGLSPDGLAGEGIPPLARVVMVADAFDAMTSKRAYRDAMSVSEAVRELRANQGKQFDTTVVDAFMKTLDLTVREW